jgi:hypothetical protein
VLISALLAVIEYVPSTFVLVAAPSDGRAAADIPGTPSATQALQATIAIIVEPLLEFA